MRVGFIGLGGWARRWPPTSCGPATTVAVNDVRREVAATSRGAGAAWAATPRDSRRLADILVTMLPGPPQVEAVLFGPRGAFDGLRPGATGST